MPQVGSAGQRKLLNSKVLIVGAGGLGSPISIYLTLAGVGEIGIVDFDSVDVTNLQRQILHYDSDIGRSKVTSAKETLNAYNPEIYELPLEELLTLIGHYSLDAGQTPITDEDIINVIMHERPAFAAQFGVPF